MISPEKPEQRLAELEAELAQAKEQARQAELKTQRMLQLVVDAIPVRVGWKDKNLIYLGCNSLYARDAGLPSPDAIIGKSDFDLAWADQAEQYRADDLDVMASSQAKIGYDESQITPDGSQTWRRINKAPLHDSSGNTIGILCSYDDITEYKQNQAALLTSEEKAQRLVAALPMGMHMYRLDDQGQLVFNGANPAADRLLGMDNSIFVGKTIEEAFPLLTETEVPARYREAAADGKTWRTEQISYDEGRVSGAFEVYAFQITPGQMAATFLDATQRKQAEQERERLQQEIIAAQSRAIQELSTPVIPVMDRIIIMPLIGTIDSLRAREITRTLLAGIRDQRAKVVILDITGVPIVDSEVANHLNKTIQAARLKGAQTIITGISDAVAEIIVDMGINWSDVETLANLQTGLVVALDRLGLKLKPV